ncbi:ATP-dependent DNA helicase DinG [Coralloluteibacterium thermophilus]|uniref:ATP-dependent DNA helicase DinG n=1 Tax=Coralloluteibacterium thermophilum TaxID=2707049 RepID=A0ABV9NK85_9GAMM
MADSPTPAPPAPPRALTDADKDAIRASYARLRESLPGYRVRASQGQMIAAVARALGREGGVAAIEAPTGTGKSMAYLLAGLPLARAAKKKLIVATATVALQEQLVQRDIPQFLRVTGNDARVVLAKGRQRYACVRNLQELASGADAPQGGLDLGAYGEVAAWSRPPRPGEPATVAALLDALVKGSWDGDIDRTPLPVEDETRPLITTTAGGCAGRRCAYLAHCPFVLARNALREADIVVANQDLVLADLMIAGDEEESGGVLLPAPQEAFYVFDEAHHLAGKAIDRGAAEVHIADARRRLARLRAQLSPTYALVDKDRIGKLALDEIDRTLAELDVALDDLDLTIDTSWTPSMDEDPPSWRAPLGVLPDDWRRAAEHLRELTARVVRWVSAAARTVAESRHESTGSEAVARELGLARERVERQHAAWWLWSLEDNPDYAPTARWVTRGRDGGLVCHASAVSAAPVLKRALWPQAAGVVLTSATLSAGGDFRAFAAQVGLPDHAETLSLASPFDLEAQARLVVPRLKTMPDDREGHAREVAAWLEDGLDWRAGNLVLFTSRRKLESVLDLLPAARRATVRAQGAKAKQALLDEHAEAVAAGEGSTLFGLASFGEGLDLPGRLCETVVVTQLPFAVPTDPVDATYAEWLESNGRNAFVEVSVPNAIRTLTQYCGRLIRSEDDAGRIVILDRRIVAKRYGAQMLRALPPFAREIAR